MRSSLNAFSLFASLLAATPTFTTANKGDWFIGNKGQITASPISSDVVQITLPMNTSNKEYGATLWRGDCITPYRTDKKYASADVSPFPISLGNGFIGFDSIVNLNITALNEGSYLNPFTEGGSKGVWTEVCVETYLYFLDVGNGGAIEKVNFLNNVLNVSIALNADFTVDNVNVEREDATEDDVILDYSDKIIAYQCNKNAPLVPLSAPPTYTQGDELSICVKDDGTGIVKVEDILELKATQLGTTPYNYVYNDGQFNTKITSVDCFPGTTRSNPDVCVITMNLLAKFFPIFNPSPLDFVGKAQVVLGDYNRRTTTRISTTGGNEDGRRVQTVGEKENSGGFEVTVHLVGDEDTTSAGPGLTGFRGLMTMILGMTGATVLLA